MNHLATLELEIALAKRRAEQQVLAQHNGETFYGPVSCIEHGMQHSAKVTARKLRDQTGLATYYLTPECCL